MGGLLQRLSVLPLLILCLSFSAMVSGQEYRVWRTRSGKTYKAKQVAVGKGRVVVKVQRTGEVRSIGFAALSDDDRAYLLPYHGKLSEKSPPPEAPPKVDELRYRDWRLTNGEVIQGAAFVRVVGHFVMLVREGIKQVRPVPRQLLTSPDRAMVEQLWAKRMRLYDETIWQFRDGASIPNTRFEKRVKNQIKLLRYGTKPIFTDIRKLDYSDQVYVSMEDSGVFTNIEGRRLVPTSYTPYRQAFDALNQCGAQPGAYKFFVRRREEDLAELALDISEYVTKTAELPTSDLVHLANYSASVGGAANLPFLFKGKQLKPTTSRRAVGLAELDYRVCRPTQTGVRLETRFGEPFEITLQEQAEVDRVQVYAAIESLAVRDMFLRDVYFHQLEEGDFLFSDTWKEMNRALVASGHRNFDGSQRRPNGGPVESDDWLRIFRGYEIVKRRLIERRERQNFADFVELAVQAFEQYLDREEIRERLEKDGLLKSLFDDWREDPTKAWDKVEIAQRIIVLLDVELEKKPKEKEKDYKARRLSQVVGVIDLLYALHRLSLPTWANYDEAYRRFATADLLALAQMELQSSSKPGRVTVKMDSDGALLIGADIRLQLDVSSRALISRPLPSGALDALLQQDSRVIIQSGGVEHEIVFSRDRRDHRDRLYAILEHLFERHSGNSVMDDYPHDFQSEITRRLKVDVSPQQFEFPRIWRKKDSRHRVTAKLVEIMPKDSVIIENGKGKQVELPLSFFSVEDQHYIRFVACETIHEVRGWKASQLFGFREWTASDGRRKVVAAYVGYNYHGATLLLPNDKTRHFPLDSLSPDDQAFLFVNFGMDAADGGLLPGHTSE